MEYDVFISHSSKDNTFAKKLYSYLVEKGYRPWLDLYDIKPGSPYARAIVDGIDNSDQMVVLCSKDCYDSSDVLNEIDQAHRQDKPLFPLLIDEVQMTGEFRYYLARRQWITASRDIDAAFQQLADALGDPCHGGQPDSSKTDDVQSSRSKAKTDKSKIAKHSRVKEKISALVNYCRNSIGDKHFSVTCLEVLQVVVFLALVYFMYGLFEYVKSSSSIEWWLNAALCVALFSSAILTMGIIKNKKKDFYAVCILDIVEIVLIAILGSLISNNKAYPILPKITSMVFWKDPGYVLVRSFGIAFNKVYWQIFIVPLIVPLHWFAMRMILMIKKNSKSAWELLK